MDELTRLEIDNIKEKITKLEKIQENFEVELKAQREILGEFDTTQKLILQKLDTIIETIDELKKDSSELKSKPAKNWEKSKWVVVSTIITSILAFIISLLKR